LLYREKHFYNWRKLYESNNLNNKIKINKKSKFNENVNEYIKKYAINNVKFNVYKLMGNIKKKFEISISKSMVYVLLRKLNITYKRAYTKTIIDKRKQKSKIVKLIKKIKNIGKENVISIDETHIEINMKPFYGWNIKGKKVIYRKKTYRRQKFSLIAAISCKKVIGI